MSKSIPSGKPMTRAQEAKVADNIIAILRKLNPSTEDAQRLIKRSNELNDPLLERFLDLGGMRYRSEEEESTHAYPATYKAKPVCEQLLALVKHFPKLDPTPALACSNSGALPKGADGVFVWPAWWDVAKTYNEAVGMVLDAIISSGRPFFNCCYEERLDEKHLHHSERSEAAHRKLAETQKGGFLVAPGQFGLLYRGKSVRRGREIYEPNEFGHGSFSGGCMILAHPERLQSAEDLSIDLGGDEYAPGADGRFTCVPYFCRSSSSLRFNTHLASNPHAGLGSASGFIP